MARFGLRRERDGAWWCGASKFSDSVWDAADFGTFHLADETARMLDARPSAISVALVPDRPCQRQTDALREAERFMAYFSGDSDDANTFVGPGTPKTCLDMIRNALKE